MAIIVQQDREPINWFSIISWTIVIGIIFTAGYYLFFIRPPLVEFVLPIKLVETATLAKIKFDSSFLIESEVFKILAKGEYGKIIIPSDIGRDNPFLNFAPVIKPGKSSINVKTSAVSTSTTASTPSVATIKPLATSTQPAASSLNFPVVSSSGPVFNPPPASASGSAPEFPIFIPPALPTSTP